jgi:hypothetical protein
MRPQQIDIELQAILTVKNIGSGLYLTASDILDALETDGFTIEKEDIHAVINHVANVKAAALAETWRI